MQWRFVSILGLAFALAGTSAQAQDYGTTGTDTYNFGNRIGLLLDAEGGVSWSRLSDEDAENKLGYNMGLSATYFFLPYVGAGAGLDYIRRGIDQVNGTYKGDVNYLDIPVYGAFHFGLGNFRLFLEPGVFYAIKMKDEFVSVGGVATEAKNYFGFQSTLGFLYGITEQLGIGVSAFAKIPLQKSSADTMGAVVGEEDRIYDWGLNLKVAYFVF